jgi:hypothetical protein
MLSILLSISVFVLTGNESMKSVFICLAITLLAVAAVVQELGCNRSYALAAPAAAVPQTSGASAKRASLAKEVAPYMPLASNIEQRREVFDQLASGRIGRMTAVRAPVRQRFRRNGKE